MLARIVGMFMGWFLKVGQEKCATHDNLLEVHILK